MITVDRLVLLSSVLSAVAGLLVLISISRPKWILSVNQGRHNYNFRYYLPQTLTEIRVRWNLQCHRN